MIYESYWSPKYRRIMKHRVEFMYGPSMPHQFKTEKTMMAMFPRELEDVVIAEFAPWNNAQAGKEVKPGLTHYVVEDIAIGWYHCGHLRTDEDNEKAYRVLRTPEEIAKFCKSIAYVKPST